MQSTFHKDSLFTYHHSFIIHLYHDRQRERKKKIHLVLAITAMVAIALGVVGIRVGFIFFFCRSGNNLDGVVSRSCFLHCHRCPSRPQKHRLSRFRKVVVHCSLLPQGIKYMGSLILTPNGYIWTHTLLRSG